MWFGTREGLNRYDSYKVRNYYIKDVKLGGSDNKISSLITYHNNIYLGTDNGIYIYETKKDRLTDCKYFKKANVIFLISNNDKIFAGTGNGLYKIENGESKLLINKNAKAICKLIDDKFLLAAGKQLMMIDENGKILKNYNSLAFLPLADPDFTIYTIYRDQKNKIWIGTNRGLYSYNDKNDRFSKIQFSNNPNQEINTVRSVTRDKSNSLYIGTENGLYVYNINSGKSENYQQSFNNDPKKLNDKAIYSTFTAKDGSVWLGTYFGGVNYIPSNALGFKSLVPNNSETGLKGKAISQMIEDTNHNIWIGTEDGGISIYHPKEDKFTYINKKTHPFYLNINNVHAIHDDGYGNIWVGTFLGGLHQLNTKTNQTATYLYKAGDSTSLSNDQVYGIYRDTDGVLWIATQSGLNIFDYQTKKFHRFKPDIFGKLFIYDLLEDQTGNLWFCTRYNGIYRYNKKRQQLTHFTSTGKNAVLSSNQIISVYKDSHQQLWFGTLDGGVCKYNPATEKFSNYAIKDGLPNNNVYGILEDDKGFMWFSTNRGLSKFNPVNKHFSNFDNKLGLPSNQFNFKSSLKTSDGTLYFGSINGVSYFNPLTIATNQHQFPLHFTDFQLFNKEVDLNTSKVLQSQIDETSSIDLSFDQNVFTISYAAINYANPGSNKYAYYLEGFEKKWNYVGDKNMVTYTNLSPGEYVFHLKVVDNSGKTLSIERTLKINVSPPFYLSKLAYAFYFVLLCLIIWLYSYFIKFLHQKKLEIQLERVEKEKIKELTQHRLNFFTFISHEFKTPLTLIIASIDKFLAETGLDFKKSAELGIIKSNASRLFKLIQQLMEFRKIETDHSSIQLSKQDIVKLLKDTILSFHTLAENKKLELNFTCNLNRFDCFFDSDKLEKIIFNILSNALKHTNEGKVELNLTIEEIDKDSATLKIEVKDTGIGMSANDINNVFVPFYRGNNETQIEGSGIGLSLVKNLINYLNGDIDITSEKGKGTTVLISLPVLINLKNNTEKTLLEKEEAVELAISKTEKEEKVVSRYNILIVEDNKELLNFLSKHFSKSYHVITATNGAMALNKINKSAPDIIISDVKMPKMDGVELCNRVKSNPKHNYIPFILLSSNETENSRMNGFDVGADAYLNKPFNLKEFDLLVMNMIKSRVQLREHVISIGKFGIDNLPRNNKDQEFLSNLSIALEKHFANPKITTEDIAKDLNMSRTLLHLNLKKLLNKSATEILNEYRLKKAVIMLENDLPIGEVAYYCGYSDPNYFSRIFKKYYQCTPLQYKENPVKEVIP
jgi:signal transduction histidine kinase/ligand-binding sensor domain-containing protein/DNA-binding response OmpR family regulator